MSQKFTTPIMNSPQFISTRVTVAYRPYVSDITLNTHNSSVKTDGRKRWPKWTGVRSVHFPFPFAVAEFRRQSVQNILKNKFYSWTKLVAVTTMATCSAGSLHIEGPWQEIYLLTVLSDRLTGWHIGCPLELRRSWKLNPFQLLRRFIEYCNNYNNKSC